MFSRRNFLKWLGSAAAGTLVAGSYPVWIEPRLRLQTTVYKLTPPRWQTGLKLRVAALADPHLINPHMPVSHWENIIALTNELNPDLVLLLGDYITSYPWRTSLVTFPEVAQAATKLKSPLGTFAIMGNHDWWEDWAAQKRGGGELLASTAFQNVGIPVLRNQALKLNHQGQGFWLSGTDSMVAIRKGHGEFESRADVQGTLAQVTDDAPIIHMAHEPDLWEEIPDRISLTLSGHTHGGQVRLFGFAPYVPSMYGQKYVGGPVQENGRQLIISKGLGCSGLPIRFGAPPEIVLLELG